MGNMGIIIVAAGQGLRFTQAGGKGDKLQAVFADERGRVRPLFVHTLSAARESQLPLCVVTRPAQLAIRDYCREAEIPLVLVENSRLGESIAAGVRSMSDCQGWIVHLADMPFVTPSLFQQVAERIVAEGIVRPLWRGKPGHPVGFGRDTFPALGTLTAEEGARGLLKQFPVRTFDVEDEAAIRDIDLPSHLPGGG
ncbi:nucleotidyltransferase family protein [Pantoea sp. FN060301]|uniref:nucleotidyltransferase family protein n=1 Tax=Pantoea sp. FN060301 TaxID=3420380 RepID=UPI003D166D9C